MRVASLFANHTCLLWFLLGALSAQSEPPSAGIRVKTTPLPSSLTAKITEIPLPVDMNLAKPFVSIGLGPQVLADRLSIDRVSNPGVVCAFAILDAPAGRPIAKAAGLRISDQDNQRLVAELKKVFMDELGAEEFGPDSIDKRTIRIWWHH